MKFQGIKRFILATFVAMAALAAWTEVSADSSVQWAGGSATERGIVPSKDLRWSKPSVDGTSVPKKGSGAIVTAGYVEAAEAAPIRQVQYTVTQAAPIPQSMTPAQRDTMFPELRPQSNTPPAGATLVPTVPSNPPSSFSAPSEPTPPAKPQPKPKSESSSSGLTPAKKPAAPKTVTPPVTPKTEPKAVELKTPDVKPDVPQRESGGIGSAPLPEITDSVGMNRRGAIKCPDNAGFKSIREISYDIRPMPGTLPMECPLNTTPYNGRHFSRTCYQWKASALCTKGAYFEDVQLERYGHSMCPLLEPVISGTRFFLTVPMLPYKMGLEPPTECVYTLGHYRVGNCSPYVLDPLPISVRAVLFEAAAIGGAVAIIP